MEETSGNMAPPGAYASHESREAQPTTSAAASATEDAATAGVGAAPPRDDDVAMNTTDASDDAGQQQASSVADVVMDEEDKQGDAADVEDSTVVLHLKFLHRERVTLRCEPAILIADLKQLVRDAYIQAISADDVADQASQQNEPNPSTQPLRLIYKGKVLKDDQTLASYSFLSEDTVHAIFSRPSAAPSNEEASANANQSATPNPTDASAAGERNEDRGDRVFLFEGNMDGGLPDISRFITSIVNSAMSTSDDSGTTATIRIYPVTSQGEASNELNGSTSRTTPTTPSTASGPQPALAHTQRGASVVPTPSISSVLPPVNPTPTPPPSAVPTTTRSGSTLLLNQAAALRRSIPALELAPLSRPPELSEEMYNLGNAMRESGDTYLAIHRQLQFLATRFQQENNLSVGERARLRSRVQQLIPVMEHVGQLSAGVSQQLADSPYGPPSSATQAGAPATEPSPTPPAPQPTTTLAPPPPFAQAVQDVFAEILGPRGANQASAALSPGAHMLNGLPGLLGNLAALAAQPLPTTARSSPQPTTGGAGPSQMMPFRSFAPQLMEFVNANPNLMNASLDDFLRAVLPMMDRHIVTCYSAGSEDFVRNGVTEVENALRLYEQAHQRVYAAQESRRNIVRLAMQELAQICMPIASSLDARSAELQAWMRRSCSHLFAELCEIAPTAAAAQMTGLLVMQLLSGNDESFVRNPSPFLERVATETLALLQRRFQFP